MTVCDSCSCFRRNSVIAHQCQSELGGWCLKLIVSWKVLSGARLPGVSVYLGWQDLGGGKSVAYDVGYWKKSSPLKLSLRLQVWVHRPFDYRATMLFRHWHLPVVEVIEVSASLQGFLPKGREETQERLFNQCPGLLLSQRRVSACSLNINICLLWTSPVS